MLQNLKMPGSLVSWRRETICLLCRMDAGIKKNRPRQCRKHENTIFLRENIFIKLKFIDPASLV